MKVDITVLDVNDNAPRFPYAVSNAIVSEAAQPGHVVAIVTASDPDQGSSVYYSILPGTGSDDFVIDADSGSLAVGHRGLDRERKEEYTLTGSMRASPRSGITSSESSSPRFIA